VGTRTVEVFFLLYINFFLFCGYIPVGLAIVYAQGGAVFGFGFPNLLYGVGIIITIIIIIIAVMFIGGVFFFSILAIVYSYSTRHTNTISNHVEIQIQVQIQTEIWL